MASATASVGAQIFTAAFGGPHVDEVQYYGSAPNPKLRPSWERFEPEIRPDEAQRLIVLGLGVVRAFALLAIIIAGSRWASKVIKTSRPPAQKPSPPPSPRQSKSTEEETEVLKGAVESSAVSQPALRPRLPAAVSSAPAPRPQGVAPPPAEPSTFPMAAKPPQPLPVEVTDEAVELEAQEGSPARAAQMLRQMRDQGRRPAASAVSEVVRAHAAEGSPAAAGEWLEAMLADEMRPGAPLFDCVLEAYVAVGDTEAAQLLLDRMAALRWRELLWVQGHWASKLDETGH